MADAYGLGDTSLISGENALTARQIQDAFTRSMAARDRQLQRYSLPQLSSFVEDSALAQAQTAAGLINQNQQLQNVIDASHHTPHGLAENLSSYLPAVGALSRLAPYLFGTDATSGVMRQGLLPWAGSKVASWFKDPNTGFSYGLDSSGKVLGMVDSNGNWMGPMPGVGGMWDGGAAWGSMTPSPSWGMNWGLETPDWTTGFGGDFSVPDWWSGFDLFGM